MKYKRGGTALSGVVLLDKPLGWTSHDLVSKLRHITGEGRVGHCGTLDPLASGLMILLIGHATRLSNDFLLESKSYRARISFGSATTTDDTQGDIVQSSEVSSKVYDADFAKSILKDFLGELDQIPPDFSALKKGGRVAHREARKGRPLHIEARKIEVHSAKLIEIDKATQSWVVDFDVSKGTYIRALARDIGQACGTHAHLCELRRLSSGSFKLEDAYSIADLEDACSQTAGKEDSSAIADFFLSRDILLESLAAERLSATSVAGRRVGPSVLTIGVFDGVHEGHQALLKTVVSRAKEKNLLSTVLTFDAHPHAALFPLKVPTSLMSLQEKVAALKDAGIDEVIVLPFNHKLSQISAEDFLLQTLPGLVQAEEIVLGSNFRFGKGASCGPAEMQDILADTHISVSTVELKKDELGIPYSSTRLRQRS
ncbi:MAG: tRNA pseudouridine(55) synthase TruB [Coriobacteriia bacterium]|nr:tRNA pseudouridine(55) synthase TruB [Coriobacteriia bacterium]